MLRTRLIAGTTASLVLSAVFASVMLFASAVDVVLEPLRVDPNEPAPVTLRLPTPPTTSSGETIVEATRTSVVARGTIVQDRDLAKTVRSYERNRRPPELTKLIGSWVMYFLVALTLLSYLRFFAPGRGTLLRTQAGLLALIGLTCITAKAILLLTALPALVVPVAVVPIWASRYLDRRTAIAAGLALAFLCGALVDFARVPVTVYLASTLGVVAFFRDRKHAAHAVMTGAAAGLVACALLLCVEAAVGSGFNLFEDIQRIHRSWLVLTVGAGVLAGLLALALQPLATFALGVVSRGRLLELTDVDHPLLQKMAREAPGSWEHSRAMANLAEGAASAIGADPLLTRVGAYYHDLGKTIQSKYFVENLETGEVSPHEQLEPDVSADAIMAHVVGGARILREGGIPEPVVEFAYTHHGTSVIEYFWHKCLEQGNPRGLTEADFRYPGMRPRTKETAILMLIDSIEAAARTVDEPTRERFEEIVQRVLMVKMRQGQLDEAGLTMTDVRTLNSSITDMLCSVYHSRIKYPWQDREESGKAQLPVGGVATEKDVREHQRE